jgi:hypothetical protein
MANWYRNNKLTIYYSGALPLKPKSFFLFLPVRQPERISFCRGQAGTQQRNQNLPVPFRLENQGFTRFGRKTSVCRLKSF